MQFLICNIIEPDRLFLRLIEKNIPKSNKILNFLVDNLHNFDPVQEKIDPNCNWLLDEKKIMLIIDKFINNLKDRINLILDDNMEHIKKLHIQIDQLYVEKQLSQIKEMIIKQGYEFTYVIDIINTIYNISKGDTSDKFVSELKTHSNYHLLKSNNIIIQFGSMKTFDSINQKISQLKNYQKMCDDHGLTYNKIKNQQVISTKIWSSKIFDCKKLIQQQYFQLLIRYMELFQGVNLGRLADTVYKMKKESGKKIIYVFEKLLHNIRLSYINPRAEIASIYYLLKQLNNLII